MPRSLAFLQWMRVLQQARHLNLNLGPASSPLPVKQRRRFLRHSALAGASLSLAGGLGACANTQGHSPSTRVAVIGAGLAGLNAAHQLGKAGVDVQVYEASDRVGGRMRSVFGAVGEGLVSDLGGELVNTDHADLRALAAELGVRLVPRRGPGSALEEAGYFFGGSRRTETELANALRPFAGQVAADAALLDEDWSHWAPYFDRLSLARYFLQHKDLLPAQPDVRGLMASLVRVEYGVAPEQSSALQLLYLLPVVRGQHMDLLSTSDEAWTVEGGSERIIHRLHQALDGRVHKSKALSRLERVGEAYRLSFSNGESVLADYIVLALPLAALRKVDIRVELPDSLQRFIQEVDLGHNEKIIAGVHERIWRNGPGFEVEAWSDQSVALIWDASLRELDTRHNGALTFFLSGREVEATASGNVDQHGRRLMREFDALMPGLEAASNGNFLRTAWHKTSGIHGGYTNLKPGQYTGFASEWMYVESDDPNEAQNVHVGRLVLAGEHTSDEFYGFMNGAAQSGRLAAQWIMSDLLQQSQGAGLPWAQDRRA